MNSLIPHRAIRETKRFKSVGVSGQDIKTFAHSRCGGSATL
jgi:hypothetical protein